MDKTLTTLAATVVLLLCPGLSWGLIYYVDAENGNDLNLGTAPEQAWQTIARVNAQAFAPGDSILFQRGQIWRDTLRITSSGEEDRPITYGAYGTAESPPIINGADIYNDNEWRREDENIWSKASHLEFDPDFLATGRAVNKFIVSIDGQRFLPVTDVNDLRENTYTHLPGSDRLFVYLATDPDEHLTESATRPHSVRIDGREYITLQDLEVMNSVYDNVYIIHASKHIVLDRMVLHHAGTRGVQIVGDELTDNPDGWTEHVRIERSAIFDNGIRCDTAATDIGINRNARYITIRDCTLYGDGANWGVDGILTGEVARGAGHLIEDNVIFGHCENEIDLKGHWESPAGEGRSIIRRNILFGSDGTIINIHLGSKDIDILYNHISTGATHGISFYNHDGLGPHDGQEGDVTIAYNIINDNRLSGIRDAGSGSAITAGGNRVYNNVIVWNGQGPDADSAGIQFQSPDWDIRNNIIWENGDGSAEYQIMPDSPESETGLVVGHNLVAVDPLFIDADGGDFRVRAESPAVDAGIGLGFAHDIEGWPVPNGAAPEIGAFEWYPDFAPAP